MEKKQANIISEELPILLDVTEDLTDRMQASSIPVQDVEEVIRYCELYNEKKLLSDTECWEGSLQIGQTQYRVVYHNIGERYILDDIEKAQICAS